MKMKTAKNYSAKILALALILTMLVTLVPSAVIKSAAADASELSIGVVSDLHYFPESLMGSDTAAFIDASKLNSTTSYLSDAVVDSAFAEYKAQIEAGKNIKYIFVAGDLTKNGELQGHKELSEKFKQFETETGVQILVINGNHDIRNANSAEFKNGQFVETKYTEPEEFREIYSDFGYDLADTFFTPPEGEEAGGLSYAATLEGGYRLIALDGGCYSKDINSKGEDIAETRGAYSEALMTWALDQIKQAKADGLTVIGLTHFNLVKHFECEDSVFTAFTIDDWQNVCETLADAGMHFAFSGHIHLTDIASHTSDSGETLTDCSTTSLLSFPNLLRTVTFNRDTNDKITVDYQSTDVDNTLPISAFGTTYPQPFKQTAFALNFGGSDINQYALNMIKWQVEYNLKPQIEKCGSLYGFLALKLDLDSVLDKLLTSNEGLGAISGITKPALKKVIINVCSQLEKTYIDNPEHLYSVLDSAIRKVTSIEVSDYPCTNFLDTFGFGESTGKGTLADLVSSVLAYMYSGDEDTSDDRFFTDAMAKFERGKNADKIFDTLVDVLLHDVIEDELLKNIHIDVAGLLKNTDDQEAQDIVSQIITGILDTAGGVGINLPEPSLMEIVNIFFGLGIVDYKSLDDVLNHYLDEYMTDSQMETIAYEFYNFLSYFTQDTNPGKCMDNNAQIIYNGKVQVVPTVKDLRLPSGIAVTLGADAADSRNISWFTKKSVTGTDIEIVPYSKNPKFTGTPTTDGIYAETETVTREYPGIDFGVIGILNYEFAVTQHRISVTGLKSDKKYCYRVGDAQKGWWSETGVIETADNSDKFTFFHMSDCQGGIERQYSTWANVVDTAYNMYPNASFIMHTGDFVDYGSNFKQWNWMFNTASGNLMNTAMMPTAGNHETKGGGYAIAENFMLSNIPPQNEESGVYYSYDYNNAHFAVLNSNDLNSDGSLSTAQTEWLTADMNNTQKQWKIVALHKSPYSNGSHYDDEDVAGLRKQLSSLMPTLGIDLVLSGHDHVYLRTDAMNNNAVVESQTKTVSYNGAEYTAKIKPAGTVYAIDGCAGVKYYQTKDAAQTDELFPRAEKIYNAESPVFSAIQIDGDNLYFDAYTVNDSKTEKIDSFSLSKAEVKEAVKNTGTEDNTNGKNPSTGTFSNNGILIIAIPLSLTAIAVAIIIIIKRRREELA